MFTKILVVALLVFVVYLYHEVRELKERAFLEDQDRDDVPAPQEVVLPATLQMQLKGMARDAARHAVEVHEQEKHRS